VHSLSAHTDVVVIGAGAAGLACARSLHDAGFRCVVWEARDRIGGRVRTFRGADGSVLEFGAQVIHGAGNPLWSFVREDDAVVSFRDAQARTVLSGRNLPMGAFARASLPPWAAEAQLLEVGGDGTVAELLAKLELPAWEVDSAAEWLRQNWGTDPERLDTNGMTQVRAAEDTGQGEYLLGGGYDQLVERLAEGLPVELSHPVEEIDAGHEQVRIRGRGRELSARAAVLTAPPPAVVTGQAAISGLPQEKIDAARGLPSGDAVSVVVELSEALPESLVVFDADGNGGFLRAFSGSGYALAVAKGKAAAHLRSAAENRGRLAALFARAGLGGGIGEVHVADWGLDPYSWGGFSFPVAGFAAAARQWAKPVADALFFAGEATCGYRHPASVHGAVASGERAAAEVKETLRC
jgi:monoamine oxidase